MTHTEKENTCIVQEESVVLNQAQTNRKERVVGLDLFKIFCSIMITIRHFIRYSSLMDAFPKTSVNQILLTILNTLSVASINGFILISGYFLIKSRFKLKRIFEIWGETLFFSICFFVLGFAFGLVEFRPVYAIFAITPIISRHYWFPVAYIVLCLISPYLNKLLNAITKKEYTILLVGGALLFSAWTTFVYYSDGAVTGGHTGILWMSYLYALGGFFALHPVDDKKIRKCAWILCGACIVVLTAYQLLKTKIGFLSNFPWLSDDSLFALTLTLSLFLLFKGIKGKNGNFTKILSAISSCSFGVYLIQENCMIREWLWFEVVQSNTMFDKYYLWLVMIGVVVGLFILAFVFNFIFRILFNGIAKLIGEKNGKQVKR